MTGAAVVISRASTIKYDIKELKSINSLKNIHIHMTTNKPLQDILDELIIMFHIHHMRIRLVIVDSIDMYGQCYVKRNQDAAEIQINSMHSYEEQVKTLIHEVVHIALSRQQEMAYDIAELVDTTEKVKEFMTDELRRTIERETDNLALGIYDLYIKVNKCNG